MKNLKTRTGIAAVFVAGLATGGAGVGLLNRAQPENQENTSSPIPEEWSNQIPFFAKPYANTLYAFFYEDITQDDDSKENSFKIDFVTGADWDKKTLNGKLEFVSDKNANNMFRAHAFIITGSVELKGVKGNEIHAKRGRVVYLGQINKDSSDMLIIQADAQFFKREYKEATGSGNIVFPVGPLQVGVHSWLERQGTKVDPITPASNQTFVSKIQTWIGGTSFQIPTNLGAGPHQKSDSLKK
jgi:hypothetical protein